VIMDRSPNLPASAWKCLYTAAMKLYIANHVSYASFVAMEALETIEPDEGLVDELAKTHYLLGCCYAVLDNSVGASEHFTLAEQATCQTTETSIKALIGKASCFGRQNDWEVALKNAQKAASLASKSQLNWLKAEVQKGVLHANNTSNTILVLYRGSGYGGLRIFKFALD